MIFSRLMGFFVVVPISLLLTISFFVLFLVRKAESQGLKAFGYVISALLWVAALLMLTAGLYTVSTGKCPMQRMMQEGKYGMMKQEMGCSKMRQGMPSEGSFHEGHELK